MWGSRVRVPPKFLLDGVMVAREVLTFEALGSIPSRAILSYLSLIGRTPDCGSGGVGFDSH